MGGGFSHRGPRLCLAIKAVFLTCSPKPRTSFAAPSAPMDYLVDDIRRYQRMHSM
jgi:hypothetical protein